MKKDRWISIVFILTFILSFIFSAISTLASNINVFILLILLVVIILIGILFDMVGVSILSCKEATFHAKASNKIKGSKECIKLIKVSDKASSITCDVIGDICGIISGSIAAIIVLKLMNNNIWCSIFITATVSSLTVGGKAIGKKIAINRCEDILFFVGKTFHKLRIFNK